MAPVRSVFVTWSFMRGVVTAAATKDVSYGEGRHGMASVGHGILYAAVLLATASIINISFRWCFAW